MIQGEGRFPLLGEGTGTCRIGSAPFFYSPGLHLTWRAWGLRCADWYQSFQISFFQGWVSPFQKEIEREVEKGKRGMGGGGGNEWLLWKVELSKWGFPDVPSCPSFPKTNPEWRVREVVGCGRRCYSISRDKAGGIL